MQNYLDKALLLEDFPDPSICGRKAFATMSVRRKINIQVASIDTDGTFHLEDRDGLAYIPQWADKSIVGRDRPWAPHVDTIYRNDGSVKQYVMYFCAQVKGGGKGIGCAVSDSLNRPFEPLDTPLCVGNDFEHIDPYVHTTNDKKMLYWGSAFKPIKRQELSEDGLGFCEGSRRVDVLSPDPTHPHKRLFEAPTVIETGGYTFMLVSGNDTFGEDDYFVSIARYDRKKDAFIPRGDFPGENGSIILKGDKYWKNPGHQDVVMHKGSWCMVFHAMIRDDNVTNRVLLGCELTYSDGWLHVKGGDTPTVSIRDDLFRM